MIAQVRRQLRASWRRACPTTRPAGGRCCLRLVQEETARLESGRRITTGARRPTGPSWPTGWPWTRRRRASGCGGTSSISIASCTGRSHTLLKLRRGEAVGVAGDPAPKAARAGTGAGGNGRARGRSRGRGRRRVQPETEGHGLEDEDSVAGGFSAGCCPGLVSSPLQGRWWWRPARSLIHPATRARDPGRRRPPFCKRTQPAGRGRSDPAARVGNSVLGGARSPDAREGSGDLTDQGLMIPRLESRLQPVRSPRSRLKAQPTGRQAARLCHQIPTISQCRKTNPARRPAARRSAKRTQRPGCRRSDPAQRTQPIGQQTSYLGVTPAFRKVIDYFHAGKDEIPAGFRVELRMESEGALRLDLVRDISYAENGVKRPTHVLFSADSANPYEVEPIKAMIANLTCNPGIIYDLFINNPKANLGHRFNTRDEVMKELGTILGPGCDISVELNNPFARSEQELLDEAYHFRELLSEYRVVIKVPHTGPVNADNMGQLLTGNKKFSKRYDDVETRDAFRGHNLALLLHEHGFRVNFTLMFEPYQTLLALQAKPYFINSFIRHRAMQSN